MLLSELNVGDKIKLNINSLYSSYLGSSIVFKIADKNHSGYPGDSITLITDKVIKFMCFDAKESKNSDSNRQSYGNNRYSVSNVLQWLNSNAAAGEWYSAQHTADAPPTTSNVYNANNDYDSIPGFLKILDVTFESGIIETNQTVVLNTVTDGGGYETVTSKVFLASATEVGIDNSTDIEEGSLLAMFSDDDSRIAYPTDTSINNDEENNVSSAAEACPWVLRTPSVNYSYNLKYVQKPNTISLSNAYYGGLGVRPLCNVYPTLLLSDTIDEDGCYVFNGISSPPEPALISIPELISGKTATITWSKPAEYPITYILERKIGADGEFEQIYSGIERSYTDNILPEYKVLTYRVRSTIADGGAASAYTTSADIAVIAGTQLLSNLEVGSKVKFGKYQVESEEAQDIVWTIVAKNHVSEPAYPDNSVTLHSSEILDLRCFDAKEPNNSNSDRQNYGNNRYSLSNLDQWLNKNAAANAWYTTAHETDQSPNSSSVVYSNTQYANRPGFLNGFTTDEINAILSTTVRVVKPSVDGGSYEDIQRKVFLPSTTEVGLSNENNIAEGSAWGYYTSNSARKGYVTQQCFSNTPSGSKPSSKTTAWYWWLRTPGYSGAHNPRIVITGGSLDSGYAYRGNYGIRPALNLSSSLLVTDTTDSDGCYTFVWTASSLEAPVFQTMSESVSAGDNIIVAWSTITEADSYDLQRSVDGGEYTNISTGTTNTLYIDTANPSWTTVQYRVRSVNDSGNSDWTESALITVQQSVSTISAPESITVPELNSGASASVAWSAVQNATGYILERSVDNSSFTEVYRGSETVYADTILSSWNTVQYRVCAYDGEGNTSEYTTSEVVSVNKTIADLLTAIRNHAEQDIKIIFDDGTVIGKSNISVSGGGLTLTEVLNGETDMTMGRAVSSLVEMVLFNTDGEFQDFNFNQEFTLQIGVKINDNFEYINLGIFKGERPEKVRGKLINFSAYDRMVYFDISAEEFITGLTFPTTLGEIYQSLCSFVGVNPVSLTFINSDKQYTFNPFSSADYTAREILAWIAEAAGAYARFNSAGNVELTWYENKNHTILKTDRFEMTESEFTTPAIDKLEVYNSYGDQLVTSGTGSNTYVISDNPFLYIENDTEIEGLQPFVNLIYNRLITFPAYNPSSLRAEWYPEIKCGDIISVVDDYGNTINFPVFSQTITWKGFGKVEYENTGGLTREIAPIQQRELEEIKKKMLRGTDLYTTVESYLNSQEGKASIVSAVGGEFVQISDGSSLTTTNAIEQLVQTTETGIENKISLTAGIGNGTIGSKVQAMLTLFANTDSSSISLAANALTLTATPKADTTTLTDVGKLYHNASAEYKFTQTSDGYYTSTNAGVANSYSYGALFFNFEETTTVTLRCISYGESNHDYGIVSQLDVSLSVDNSDDGATGSTNVLHNFKGESSSNYQDITLSVPSGTHKITFKYRKDSSQDSYDDCFKIRALTTKTIPSNAAILTLKSGSTSLTSAEISFTGSVTFYDLETAGSTVINGANIKTDNLFVKNVYLNAEDATSIWDSYTILTSELASASTTTVKLGAQTGSEFASYLYLYGNYIAMVNNSYANSPGSDPNGLLFLIGQGLMTPNQDGVFDVGSSSKMFNNIYGKKFYLASGTYLTYESSHLRLYNSAGTYTNIT